jgi:hypothetical protein
MYIVSYSKFKSILSLTLIQFANKLRTATFRKRRISFQTTEFGGFYFTRTKPSIKFNLITVRRTLVFWDAFTAVSITDVFSGSVPFLLFVFISNQN